MADLMMPELYENLTALCSRNVGFYFKDVQFDSIQYRIFNYRLCSYEQFHTHPSALNCRGSMFDVTDSENVKLVCLPPEKFFNYEEGNGLNIHPLGTFGVQMEKLDGSLISTYLHKGQVRLKSKASLTSEQATETMKLLKGTFLREVTEIVRENKTVNFEYTSPSNQVVVYYNESKLRILSIRCHLTGDTLFGDRLIAFLEEKNLPTMIKNTVSYKRIAGDLTHEQLVRDIRDEPEGEGYVIEIINSNHKSYLVKIKTHKYLALHHAFSNSTSAKHLFECVINEQTDDLRSLFVHKPDVLRRIEEMESKVRPIYNNLIHTVQSFYEDNKHLSRKDYAIKITNSVNFKIYMALLMNLYAAKDNDYQKFALGHMKDIFGIVDDLPADTNTTEE